MIDTLELGYQGPVVGDAELRAFREAITGPIEIKLWQQEDDDVGEQKRWMGLMEGVGRVALNADGYVRFGRSLAKVKAELIDGTDPADADNKELLTAGDVDNTFQVLTTTIEHKLPFLDPDTMDVTRADICYQRPVKNSMVLFQSLLGAVKPTRGEVAWFQNSRGEQTGLRMGGKKVVHRIYDKGIESKDRHYYGIVRSEEQLRKGSKGMGRILDVRQRVFNRDGCRDVLNERYLDVAYEEQLDVTDLVRAGSDTVALLILHPELMEVYRERVKPNAFYKMKKQIREKRAAAIPDDLRVPEEAWLKAG